MGTSEVATVAAQIGGSELLFWGVAALVVLGIIVLVKRLF